MEKWRNGIDLLYDTIRYLWWLWSALMMMNGVDAWAGASQRGEGGLKASRVFH
jgi:hypothetical protein